MLRGLTDAHIAMATAETPEAGVPVPGSAQDGGGLGFRVYFPKLGVSTIMENQMEKNMENEMETGFI